MPSAHLSPTTTIGELATRHPASTRVFHRRGIDFCCAGAMTLEEACRARGLDVQLVLHELTAELTQDDGKAVVWAERSTLELVEHLLRYHVPLRDELVRLEGLALKVLRMHGAADPVHLQRLADVVRALRYELEAHMDAEERRLFPWLLSGRPVPQSGGLGTLMVEHDEAEALLDEVRELTEGFTPPRADCATWRALWNGLETLERELHEHMHLENNVLFPRAFGDA